MLMHSEESKIAILRTVKKKLAQVNGENLKAFSLPRVPKLVN